MNNQGETTLAWGDGIYSFRLTMNGIVELEQICNEGIGTIVARVSSGGIWVRDVRETIRLGLVGGGMEPAKAVKLVSRYVDDLAEFPIATNIPFARAILLAAYVGFESSPLAEAAEVTTSAAESPPASTPPPSSTSAAVWDLSPEFWTEFRSGHGPHS